MYSSFQLRKNAKKRDHDACDFDSANTECCDLHKEDTNMSFIAREKRARYGVIPYEYVTIPVPTKCMACTLPWVSLKWSEDEWMASYVCMLELNIGIWDVTPCQRSFRNTNNAYHKTGCSLLPTTTAWITLHSAKYICSRMTVLDSYAIDMWSCPLVRINKIVDNGSVNQVHLSLFIFTNKSTPFATVPKHYIRLHVPSTLYRTGRHSNAEFVVNESDVFDMSPTIDHPNLKQFQRALLSQTIKLCSRQTFLEYVLLNAPYYNTSESFQPSFPVVDISNTIIVRRNMVDKFSDMMTQYCNECYVKTGKTTWYPGGILVSKAGTGKTVMGCRLLNYFWNSHKHNAPLLLIVSPGMFEIWQTHLDTWASDIPKDQIVFVKDHKTMAFTSIDNRSTKRLIVTTKFLYQRKRSLQLIDYSTIIIDDIHKNLPSFSNFPIIKHTGCIVGLTACNVEKTDTNMLFLERLRVVDFYNKTAMFNSITGNPISIEHDLMNPVARLSSNTYVDTGNPIICIPATCKTVHIVDLPIHMQICKYLYRAATALVSIESMTSFTTADFYDSLKSQKTVTLLYQDMHRLLAGDDRVIDPVTRIAPLGTNVSKDPFFKILTYDATIEKDCVSDGDRKCAICLSDATNITMLDCNHVFCSDCIREWYMCARSNGKKCPNCRSVIKKGYTSNDAHFYMYNADKEAFINYECMENINALVECIEEFALRPAVEPSVGSSDLLSSRTKMIIVTRFSTVVRCIAERLARLCPSWKISRCTKTQTISVHSKCIREFCSGDTDVLVIDYSSAIANVNFTVASKLIMYGWFDKIESNHLEEKMMGIGQKNDSIHIVNVQGAKFEKTFTRTKRILSENIAAAYAFMNSK